MHLNKPTFECVCVSQIIICVSVPATHVWYHFSSTIAHDIILKKVIYLDLATRWFRTISQTKIRLLKELN